MTAACDAQDDLAAGVTATCDSPGCVFPLPATPALNLMPPAEFIRFVSRDVTGCKTAKTALARQRSPALAPVLFFFLIPCVCRSPVRRRLRHRVLPRMFTAPAYRRLVGELPALRWVRVLCGVSRRHRCASAGFRLLRAMTVGAECKSLLKRRETIGGRRIIIIIKKSSKSVNWP